MRPVNVTERLQRLGGLFASRNAEYKNNYRKFGGIVHQITGPVKLETADDFNRFALFVQVVAKVTRYGHNFANGGHPDSLDDCSVYAQMLREVDDGITMSTPHKELMKHYSGDGRHDHT